MTIRRPLVVVAGQIHEMPLGDSIAVSYNGGTDPIIASFSGPVVTAVGTARYYHPSTTTITSAYLSLGTASTAGSVVVAIKCNGSTIDTLTLASSSYLSTPVTLSQAITPGDYLTVDVTSAGTDAEDLMVYLVVSASAGAAALIAKDEGSVISSAVASIDFIGAGITVTNTGDDVTVTIAGGGAYGNLDNGTATSTFGGITPIDCGSATA